MTVEPIKPQDIGAAKQAVFPADVIDCWNGLIAKTFDGGSATVKQDCAVAALMARTGQERSQIFAEGWLNVEPIYEAAGWKVTYNKPGWNESGEAFFVFSR